MRDLRARLRRAGVDPGPGPVDAFDEATAAAVARFQTERGLVVDGECGPQTWASLVEAGYTLGDRLLYRTAPMLRGDDVADLQLRLGTLGFDAGRVDGIFGPDTQRALGEFQANAGLVVDEVCGPETVAALCRMRGRAGTGSVAGVREREELRQGPRRLLGRRVCVADGGELGALGAAVAAALQHAGSVVALVRDHDPSRQAQRANDFGAHLVLGLTMSERHERAACYFATAGFESVGGRRLAALVARELPAVGAGAAASVVGMRIPLLRETRAPAVVVRLGPPADVVQHTALLAAGLQRAVQRWVEQPDDDPELDVELALDAGEPAT